jgi:hypothetical protein
MREWFEVSSAILFVRLEVVFLLVQALEGDFAIGCQIWATDGRHCARKEAGAPLLFRSFALRCLLALLLFDFRLERCRERELFADDGVGHTVPEFERFVGELLFHRGNGFGEREERIDIDDEVLLLCECKG